MRAFAPVLAAAAIWIAPSFAIAQEKLDVLFVIDDTGGTSDFRFHLRNDAAMQPFFDALAAGRDGLPDLHVGIVTSDSGIGQVAAGCTVDGDDGLLQAAGNGTCPLPDDLYIIDSVRPDGSPWRNYSGSLGEVFGCMLPTGLGCAFERHLESMWRALDGHRVENAGFLRDDAWLAVVIVADEDDCSALDEAVYDPSQTELTDPLGPLASFRCTEFGVMCDGMTIARGEATYQVCEPRGDSYLHHPQHYLDLLQALKPDGRLFVAVVAGDIAPFAIGLDQEGHPDLLPSCGAAGLAAIGYPGIRFEWLVEQLGDRAMFASFCDVFEGEVFSRIAQAIIDVMARAGSAPDAGIAPPADAAGGPADADVTPDASAGSTPSGCDCAIGSGRDLGGVPAVLFVPIAGLFVNRRRCER
jgi:hypothetical protein